MSFPVRLGRYLYSNMLPFLQLLKNIHTKWILVKVRFFDQLSFGVNLTKLKVFSLHKTFQIFELQRNAINLYQQMVIVKNPFSVCLWGISLLFLFRIFFPLGFDILITKLMDI